MRRNGFIFIALAGVTVALADSPGYLPTVGPVALLFRASPRSLPSERAAVLPPLYIPLPEEPEPTAVVEPNIAPTNAVSTVVESPTNAASPEVASQPLSVIEVAPPASNKTATEPLISSSVDSNADISPQVYLRYFTPFRPGLSSEAIVVPPTDFMPAFPTMTPPSRASYTQPEP